MKVIKLLGLASVGISGLYLLTACSETDGSQYSTYLECVNSEVKQGSPPKIAGEFCSSLNLPYSEDTARELRCRADTQRDGCEPYVARAQRVEQLSQGLCGRNFDYKAYKAARNHHYSDREIIEYLEKDCAERRAATKEEAVDDDAAAAAEDAVAE